jgi:hypothetical protein
VSGAKHPDQSQVWLHHIAHADVWHSVWNVLPGLNYSVGDWPFWVACLFQRSDRPAFTDGRADCVFDSAWPVSRRGSRLVDLGRR